MIIDWFVYGPNGGGGGTPAPAPAKRGGAGQGITTTGLASTSYLDGPPSSTHTKWRGAGDEPAIAGSTGGFIGLISGVVILVIIAVFAGIYIYNRKRKRLTPTKTTSPGSGPGFHNPLPSLSFSRPSTDPYSHEPAGTRAYAAHGSRPVYTRQKSSEWEMDPSEDSADVGLAGKYKSWSDKDREAEVEEAALPLRTRSASPGVAEGRAAPELQYGQGSSITPNLYDEGGPSGLINPFENPYDDDRLTPHDAGVRRQGSQTSLGSFESDIGGEVEGEGEGDITDRQRLGVSQIRPGTRFVERIESKESLA